MSTILTFRDVILHCRASIIWKVRGVGDPAPGGEAGDGRSHAASIGKSAEGAPPAPGTRSPHGTEDVRGTALLHKTAHYIEIISSFVVSPEHQM